MEYGQEDQDEETTTKHAQVETIPVEDPTPLDSGTVLIKEVTTLVQLTFDQETAEIVIGWKNQGYNITTMLIMCANYALKTKGTNLISGYERKNTVRFGVRTPSGLCSTFRKATKKYGMNRSELWDACVRTTVRDLRANVKVPLSILIPEPSIWKRINQSGF